MKALVQRVSGASVSVDGEQVGSCKAGYLILFCACEGDTDEHAVLLAKKTASLRVISDEDGKMNLSVTQVGGEVLCISQFTLCADIKKGNRPSFTSSAEPCEAKRLYELYCQKLRENGIKHVSTGVFGADMKVSLINDGPVTIMLDTDIWMK